MARTSAAENPRRATGLASGRRTNGSSVSAVMPFNALKATSDTDTDADALYLYLKSLSPRNTSER